jgi:hypothetical protein
MASRAKLLKVALVILAAMVAFWAVHTWWLARTRLREASYAGDLPRVLWEQDTTWPDSVDWSNPSSCRMQEGTAYCGNPAYGPIGTMSVFTIRWDDLEPGPGYFIWDTAQWEGTELYRFLHPNPPQYVTLDDGTVIGKPLGFGVFLQDGGTWSGSNICGQPFVPAWVANGTVIVNSTDGSNCRQERPNYEGAEFQAGYDGLVDAMIAEFNDDVKYPNLYIFTINLGIDGESKEHKQCQCSNGQWFSPSGNEAEYDSYWCGHVMSKYNGFTEKIALAQFVPGGTGGGQSFARTLANNRVGVKCNGWYIDAGDIELYVNDVLYGGGQGFSTGYTWGGGGAPAYQVIPTGMEPKGMGTGSSLGEIYYSFMGALAYHPHYLDVQFGNFQAGLNVKNASGFDILRFARDYIDRTIETTPGVWIVFRNTAYGPESWGSTTRYRQSGTEGNYEYWLYEVRTAAGSASQLVPRSTAKSLIANQNHPYSGGNWEPLARYGPVVTDDPPVARRTDRASGNDYISLNINDGLPATKALPYSKGGTATWYITVTYADSGTDSWQFQYYNFDNQLVAKTVTKGNTRTWKDAGFVLLDAYFDGGLSSGADFRLYNGADGDDIFHRVIVVPAAMSQPITPSPSPSQTPTSIPATPTGTRTRTATPSATRTPTSVSYTATPTATTSPTPFPAGQNVVVLQQGLLGYGGTADTYITQLNQSANLATQAGLIIRNDSTYEALLQFETLSIPAGTIVNQATLRLYSYSRDSTAPMDVQVYGLLRPWVDTQANWGQASTANPWALPGANDPLTDRSSNPATERSVLSSSGWYSFEVTALVRGWVGQPQINYGMILRGSGADSVGYNFASANYPVISVRPQLVIDYTILAPTDTPTPSPTRTLGTPTPATATPTITRTPTRTLTATPTVTATRSPTPILTPTPTPRPIEQVLSDLERRLGLVQEILLRIIEIFKQTTQTGQ